MTISSFAILLLVASLVALVSRRVRFPYSVGLFLTGALMAALGYSGNVELTGDLIFNAFLPPLIFEAAFALQWKEIRPQLARVLLLATLGVVLSAVLVAYAMHGMIAWALPTAFVFGSLIAATDPVAVLAILKEVRVRQDLSVLLESESLFNDAIAAVVFGVAMAGLSGLSPTVPEVALGVARELVGGLVIGFVVAKALVFMAGKTNDHLVEIMLTSVAAFGSFAIASHFHASGILASLVAGLLLSDSDQFTGHDGAGKETVTAFWQYAAFVANSILFLLIGIQGYGLIAAHPNRLLIAGAAILAAVAARAATVYVLSGSLRWSRARVPMAYQHLLFWGGLRGALAVALAVSIPETISAAADIQVATYGVVAFSVVMQGLTFKPLIKKLGVGGDEARVLPITVGEG
ncbi:MAG: sodium:proton antiporter [Armatimonadetes bacterium]|nr:sodium:proton antiporter [Armatimonadota bacterium]